MDGKLFKNYKRVYVEKLNKDKPSESMWDKLNEEEKAKVTGKK